MCRPFISLILLRRKINLAIFSISTLLKLLIWLFYICTIVRFYSLTSEGCTYSNMLSFSCTSSRRCRFSKEPILLSLLFDKIKFFSLEQLGPKIGNTVRSLWAKLRNLSRINLLISYTDFMEL